MRPLPLLALASTLGLAPLLFQTAQCQVSENATAPLKVSIKVLPGQVRFETTRFDVTAGKPVELTFSNGCIMPHNLVILKPDAEPAVIAGVNALGLEGLEKNFVPEVPGIVAATKLLQPQAKEVLTFSAPQETGDYPYVCTFPGHWYTMRGVMRVRASGVKLEAAQRVLDKPAQVPDALKHSEMSHKPMGTMDHPFVMRTFALDPGLDPAVFAHHGVGKDAVKYDPATRLDITKKEADPQTGVVREIPIPVPSLKGVAGAIAVSHGPDFSYVWDSTECRLFYAWRGGFLDMNPYWGQEPGGSRSKVYLPLIVGHLVYRASGAMPLAEPNDPSPVFLGYKMEGGLPEFRYQLGQRVIREKVLPSAKDGFEVRVTVEGGATPNWKVNAADLDVTTVRSENGGLAVAVKDRPEPEHVLPPASPKHEKH